MRKVFLGLLAVIVVLGLFAAAGYAGYRFGYIQGARTTAQGNPAPGQPQLRPFDDFGRRGMPMHRFGFERGFGRGGFPMIGFGLFAIFGALTRLAVLALIAWFVYWLFTRSGWRLTRQPAEIRQPAAPPPPTEESSSHAENE